MAADRLHLISFENTAEPGEAPCQLLNDGKALTDVLDLLVAELRGGAISPRLPQWRRRQRASPEREEEEEEEMREEGRAKEAVVDRKGFRFLIFIDCGGGGFWFVGSYAAVWRGGH